MAGVTGTSMRTIRRPRPEPGERPLASPLARLCAARSPAVTNLLQRPVDLGADQQAVLQRLDGRTSVAQLSASLAMAPEAIASVLRELAACYLLLLDPPE